MKGLNPTRGSIFHAMGGREGLIDTAVKLLKLVIFREN